MPLYWVVEEEVQAAGQAISDLDLMSLGAALSGLGWALAGLSAYWNGSNAPTVGLGPSGITFYWYFWNPNGGSKDSQY